MMCELKQECKSKITNNCLKNQFAWEKKYLEIEIWYLYSLKI